MIYGLWAGIRVLGEVHIPQTSPDSGKNGGPRTDVGSTRFEHIEVAC